MRNVPVRGGEYVQHVVRIARELPEIAGQAPRLYVVTRNAQTVLADDRANLEQGGLRGLLRVIGAEHPHLHTTHIDVDEQTDAEQVARQLLSGLRRGRDRLAQRRVVHGAAVPRPRCAPRSGEPPSSTTQHDGMRLQIRTPGDLQTMEFAAFDRVPPGPGQIEVAVSASSINFADVLIAFGRYPEPRRAASQQLGTDFAGVVTAVGTRRHRSPGR